MATFNLVRRLEQSVRRGRVLSAPAQLAGYDADGLGYKAFRPEAVVIPADLEELAELLQQARGWGVPVTLRGAGTSLSGGPVAAQGGVVVHTSALRRIREISPAGQWCEVECGVVLNQLDAALLPYGLFYPPDPSSGPVCTLGGNIAMNAGGAHCFRYGVTSNYVLGVEAVTLDGRVHRFGGPAGGRGAWRDDWKRLMVGSEGTLAAFTRFWLRLSPRPDKCWTYRATFPDLASSERAIHALARHASFPVAIELMDPRCVAMVENSPMAVGLPKNAFLIVTEIDGPAVLVDARAQDVATLLRQAGATSVESSDDDATRKGLWKARKVAGGLMGQISPDFLVQDAVIPKRALAEILQLVYSEADAAGLPVVNVFHAGDGNLHPNFLFDSRKPGDLEKVEAISGRLMQRVIEVGGTLSGEHGIGNDKTAYMPLVFSGTTLRLQLAVPKVFNPAHQLNPLKVFATRRFERESPPVVPLLSAAQAQTRDHLAGDADHEPMCDATRQSPLFTPFLDEIDGTLCLPATATRFEVESLAQEHCLRFPLWLDAEATLARQVAASGFAPGSSRFGPYCDNILGMNWKLPGGRVIRLGERVVKSTTGYDLLRFLLQSQGDFGAPVDFVIRLRPDCGTSGQFRLSGPDQALCRAADELRATCWLHWVDTFDLLIEHDDAPGTLRVSVNCPEAEWPVYETRLRTLAAAHGLTFDAEIGAALPPDGLPDLAVKTSPERVSALARLLAIESGGRSVALLSCGVIHLDLPERRGEADEPGVRIAALMARYETDLFEIGGDWQSRHVARPSATGIEADWLTQLEREFAEV
jgi:glycolate oxidase subunit GlcD